MLPQGLRAEPLPAEHHGAELHPDLIPLSYLIFGTSDEELADVTEFRILGEGEGFEVCYVKRGVTRIGSRKEASRTFKIDGPGGERLPSWNILYKRRPSFLMVSGT